MTNDEMTIKYLFFLLFLPLTLSAQVDAELQDSLPEMEMVTDTAVLPVEEMTAEYDEYTPSPLAPMTLRNVPEAEWDKATGGMDYSKDVPKPPADQKERVSKESESPFDWSGLTQGMGTIFQVLAVLFALIMLSYGIYWMMQTPRNRILARDGTEITLANLEEYIHETDLERFLRQALAASDWPLAVRLYFLQTIKSLSENQAIVWSKEKTNRDYLREMRGHRLGAPFRDVTRQYEQVWYGNQPITRADFEQLEPAFKSLLGGI